MFQCNVSLHTAFLTFLLIAQAIGGDLSFQSKVTSVQDHREDAELRVIITTLLRALETNDVETYMSLWSQNAPNQARRVERMPKQMASIKFKFSNPVFSHTNISADKASLRLAVDSETFAPGDAQPLIQRIFYNFTFRKEQTSWKLWNQTDAQRDLAAALSGANSGEERETLLRSEAELVNIYLVQDLMDQGKADFLSNPKQAMRSFQLANELAERLNSSKPTNATKQTIAVTLHNLANIERALGNYDRVLEYEERALSLSSTDNARAEAFINIGIVHALQNNYVMSMEFFDNALRAAEKIPDERSRISLTGLIYDSIGNLQTLQGNLDEALDAYKNSLKYRADPLAQADTADNIGIVYELKGQFKAAEEQYKAALAVFEGKFSLGTATVLNNLASVSLKNRDPRGAIEYAKRSAQIANEIEMPELQWRASLIEGKAHRALDEAPAARRSLEQSIKGIENMRRRIAGGLEDRQRFLQDKIEPFSVMIDLLMSEGEHEQAFQYAERAKARVLVDVLSSDLAVIRKAMTSDELLEEQNYLFQLANLEQNIRQAQVNASAATVVESLRNQRKTTQQNYDEFISRLFSRYSRLKPTRGEHSVIGVTEAAALIPDNESALLEFSVGEDQTYLYVFSRSTANSRSEFSTYKIDTKRAALKDQIDKFRFEIDNEGADFREPAKDLYRLLLTPASKQLAGKKTLVIVPDGPLWELPFQALQTTDGRFLVETCAISQAPSLTALQEMSRPESKSKDSELLDFMALINPVVSSEVTQRVQQLQKEKLGRLPNPQKQLNALRQIYGRPPRSVIYTGIDASEKRFIEEGGRYRILYLFTHGVLDNRRPMHSFLVLSPTPKSPMQTDGLLEASELLRMKVKTNLIIFSGCETARGGISSGEGVIGLAWASFVAGSPAVVVTHWRVPVQSTPQLMIEFHRILENRKRSGSNVSIARALQLASLKVKNIKGYEHPLYWAGFTIVGDGR